MGRKEGGGYRWEGRKWVGRKSMGMSGKEGNEGSWVWLGRKEVGMGGKEGRGCVWVGRKEVECMLSNPCYVCTDAKVESKHDPDPVNEICTDFPVKIADLGNACWTVSRTWICTTR